MTKWIGAIGMNGVFGDSQMTDDSLYIDRTTLRDALAISRRYPDLAEVEVDAPIFIVAAPRSRTTLPSPSLSAAEMPPPQSPSPHRPLLAPQNPPDKSPISSN